MTFPFAILNAIKFFVNYACSMSWRSQKRIFIKRTMFLCFNDVFVVYCRNQPLVSTVHISATWCVKRCFILLHTRLHIPLEVFQRWSVMPASLLDYVVQLFHYLSDFAVLVVNVVCCALDPKSARGVVFWKLSECTMPVHCPTSCLVESGAKSVNSLTQIRVWTPPIVLKQVSQITWQEAAWRSDGQFVS